MVNIKMYGRRERLLDTSNDPSLDYYLVLCGPKAIARSETKVMRTGIAPAPCSHAWRRRLA